jgi:hypothetical protein
MKTKLNLTKITKKKFKELHKTGSLERLISVWKTLQILVDIIDNASPENIAKQKGYPVARVDVENLAGHVVIEIFEADKFIFVHSNYEEGKSHNTIVYRRK